MNTLWKTKENKALVARTLRMLGAAALALALLIVAVDTSQAQQIPRRLNSLQLIKPIAPAPVPPVERLRQDIIRAVNPRTGRVDVKQLYKPPPPGLGGTPTTGLPARQLSKPPSPGLGGTPTQGSAATQVSQPPRSGLGKRGSAAKPADGTRGADSSCSP